MKKGLFGRIVSYALIVVSAISFAMATIAWFASPGGTADKNLKGEVGLRGYFYSGDGSIDHPYEIVSPVHFYNLTRLQNLGLFLNESFNFQIGHDFGSPYGLCCINTYKSNGQPNYDKYLDMEEFSRNIDILPVGGEGAPFIGHFDGKGIPIKNLTVSGYPEDIGVFGYVSYEGIVEGLVCDNLTIRSLGYSSSNTDKSHLLFSQDIDYIFDSQASALAKQTKLHFFKYNGSGYEEYGNRGNNGLTQLNGINGTQLTSINKESNIKTGTSYFNGFFVPEFPTNGNGVDYPFKYSWRSSSGVLCESSAFGVDINDYKDGHNIGDVKKPMVIDLTTLRESDDFNSGNAMQVDARLSLIASIEIDGFVFSRVIQSYTCEFYSNGHSDSGWIKKNSIFSTVESSDPAGNYGLAGDYCYRTDTGKLFYKDTPETWTEISNQTFIVSDNAASRSANSNYSYYIHTTYSDEQHTFTYYDFYIRESSATSWAEKTIGFISADAPDSTPAATGAYFVQDIVANESHTYKLFQKVETEWKQISALTSGEGNPATRGLLGGVNDYYIDTSTNPIKLYKKNATDFFDSTLYCDYALKTPVANDYNTNYHHGNNIGFLAGHVDGTIKKSYVYNGKFEFNDPSFESIDSETETGLVGEIGTNVVNTMDPDYGLTIHGDTGVMNFSNIYKMIRRKAEVGDYVYANTDTPTGSATSYNWVSYNDQRNPVSFERFKKYLRHSYAVDPSDYKYIINCNRNQLTRVSGEKYSVIATSDNLDSVDFLWNQIIEDEDGDEGDRGLGVFKVVTSFNEEARSAVEANPENYYYHMYDNYGACELKNKTPEKTKVYFSTAEYDYKQNQKLFGQQSSFDPLTATTFPSDGSYDSKSFQYPFSRDYDYCVEFDLTQLSDSRMNDKNYLYNTSSEFLKSYLSTKLFDKTHTHIKTTDPRFGFMFKSSKYEDMTSLSSYMAISHPEGKNNFQQYHYIDTKNVELYKYNENTSTWAKENSFGKGEALPETPETNYFLVTSTSALYKNESSVWKRISSTDIDKGENAPTSTAGKRYYPSNSIVFRIDNEKGANVSVVGNGNDITIFKNPNVRDNSVLEPLFTMKSSGKNGLDKHRYFTYDAISGATSEEVKKYGAGEGEIEDMKDTDENGSAVYAHIFFLEQGDYVIGADDNSALANIYFLAVQGQTDGTLGANDMAGIGNAVTDVDFLVEEPTYEKFNASGDNGLKFASFSFKGTFNVRNGTFTIGPEKVGDRPEYLSIRFQEGSQTCVTYLLAYAYSELSSERHYYVNGTLFDGHTPEYEINNTD